MSLNEEVFNFIRLSQRETYIMEHKINGKTCFKIGKAMNAEERLRDLNNHGYKGIKLITTIPFDIEYNLKCNAKELVEKRLDGETSWEWFEDCKEIRELINIFKQIENLNELNTFRAERDDLLKLLKKMLNGR